MRDDEMHQLRDKELWHSASKKNYKNCVYAHWNVINYYHSYIYSFRRCATLNVLLTWVLIGDGKTAIFVSRFFIADIKFQDIVHEGDKVSVLYCDVTGTKFQKQGSNVAKSNLSLFLLFEIAKFASVKSQRSYDFINYLSQEFLKRN